MNTCLDYIDWRGDLTFAQSPVNEIDLTIFSQIVMLDFGGIADTEAVSLGEAVKKYFEIHRGSSVLEELGPLQPDEMFPNARAAAKSRRFRDTKISNFVNYVDSEATEQFCAMTVHLPGNISLIVFRGTDDSITGWKEDFMFATSDCTPAQTDALEYLEQTAGQAAPSGPILLCGHSKGGNLAAYAAVNTKPDIRKRVVRAYNLDGPGFSDALYGSEAYRAVQNRIITVRSQNSTIGTILNTPGKIRIVRSHAQGMLAHDVFTWEVKGTKFVPCRRMSESSIRFENALRKTLDGMSISERKAFIEEVFEILQVTGAGNLKDLVGLSLPDRIKFVKRLGEGGKVINKFFRSMLEQLMIPNIENPVQIWKE